MFAAHSGKSAYASLRMVQLLPHLAAVCREAREEAGVGPALVAGEANYSASTSISRTFENAVAWPKDPDKVVNAYARTTRASVFDLWDEAVRRAREDLAAGAEREADEALQATRPASGKSPSQRAPRRSSG